MHGKDSHLMPAGTEQFFKIQNADAITSTAIIKLIDE